MQNWRLNSAEPLKILDTEIPSAGSSHQDVTAGSLFTENSFSLREELIACLSLGICFDQPPITKAGPEFRHFLTLMDCITCTARKRRKKNKGKTALHKEKTAL